MNAYEEINRIYADCHEDTKAITHRTKGRTLFSKQFKSVHDLHHEGSKLVEGPVAIIAEVFYRVWVLIRDGYLKLKKALLPRRDNLIYGTKSDGRVVGYLTFSRRDDHLIPLHHMRLELWGRTKWGSWMKFSEGFTEPDGTFALPFDMLAVHRYRVRSKLFFELHHTGQYFFQNGKAKPQYELYERIVIKKSSLTGMDFSLGHLLLPYWEYRQDTHVPRVYIKDHDKEAPQRYKKGRVDAISEQFIPIELITNKHLRLIREHPDQIDIPKIQLAYPENLTMCMEKLVPGITRTDAWFGIRLMNGMYASNFDRDPENPDLYWVHYHWSTYEHTDDYIFPDVSIRLKLLDNGYMTPVEITLRGKISKADTDPKVVRKLTPADGPRWEAAKRIARVSGGLATEFDKHFSETHANTEQYAIATYRNVRRNPIGALLFPHLKEVILINHTADKILLSDTGYIPRSTAITARGAAQRVADVLGTLDWKNWKPLTPVSDQHSYARVANLYWDMLYKYTGEFIATHVDEIKEEWHEIFRFSQDLVNHSVPRFLCAWLCRALELDENGLLAADKSSWFDRSNRMDLSISRPEVDGVEKAISSLTENSEFIEGKDDLSQLQQLCTYIIWQTTFGHYWSNSKQYDDIGEIRYNSLGIRFGDSELGALGPEEDDSISPDLKIATQMMWWSNMLSRTGYGFIMSDEDKDIPPHLIEKLKAQEEIFAALDINIYDLQSRTNI